MTTTAPLQRTPLTSSTDRMHVMDETCWCLPNILAEGAGDSFRVLEIDHRDQIMSGDRVAVDDPGLAELRAIMRSATGEEPPPNNEGVVETEWDEDGTIVFLIDFDDGGASPYPMNSVRRIA
jgi:hypothetical protein